MNNILRFVFISLIAYAQFSEAQLLDKESSFIQQTAHLNFLAPKKCAFKVEIGPRKLVGSFTLGLQAQCSVEVSKIKEFNDTVAKKVDVAICAMLIPSLNTSGKDFLSSCKKKSETKGLMIFEGCGPNHNIRTELDLETSTIAAFPTSKRDEYLKYLYDMKNKKLYPKSVELKSLLYDLKLSKIEYSGDVPTRIDISDAQQKFSVAFSECEKQH